MFINNENIFLIVLAIIWIIGAVLQDLRRREVDNLWNFSLIAFALAYRAAVSTYTGNYWFILNGIIGLVIFLILGNVFYYSRVFAGGDAKLLIALGTILPLSYNWAVNFKIFGAFILLFLITGAFYVLIWSLFLVFFNFNRFKKQFKKQFKNYRLIFAISLIFSVLWIIAVIFLNKMYFIPIFFVILLFPVLFVFAKAVEESCMIRSLSPSKITEGDWLYGDITINGKKIEATWDGVSEKELKWIQKYSRKNILIKQGVPFTPGFLFGFLVLIYILYKIPGWF
ncbi:Preflagellin peptidase [uncultured archaeon]|nr:Preflagellin peptidase [uncultured archaeon]